MKNTLSLFLAALFMGFIGASFYISPAHSVSDTSQAVANVETDIAINRVSDLDFGSALPGDPNKIIAPGNAENAENASFLVDGIAGSTITISLPPGSVFITEPLSGDQLEVDRFRSRPNGTGRIRNNGERMIFVGARRRPIPNNASPGLYQGSFTITVVY